MTSKLSQDDAAGNWDGPARLFTGVVLLVFLAPLIAAAVGRALNWQWLILAGLVVFSLVCCALAYCYLALTGRYGLSGPWLASSAFATVLAIRLSGYPLLDGLLPPGESSWEIDGCLFILSITFFVAAGLFCPVWDDTDTETHFWGARHK